MMGKLYTMGCGILKGTHKERKEAFQKRICEIDTGGIGMRFVDIRKYKCGSRNGQAFSEGTGMCDLINEIWPAATYISLPCLCNAFGSTQAALQKYAAEFRHDPNAELEFNLLLKWIREGDRAIVLLCSERKAFKPNGTSWNCHRVPLALELLTDLGEAWGEVKHL